MEDEYLPNAEKTKIQINTASEVIELIEKYIENKK